MNQPEFINDFFERKDYRLGRFKYGRRLGNIEMDAVALYSYGTHFPLAVETHFDQYILNGDSYSNSTSSHQTQVRRAVPKDIVHAEIPFSTLRILFNTDTSFSSNVRTCELVRQVKILDTTEAEIRKIPYFDRETGKKKIREEHMLGAALIRFNGRYLLSGTDPGAHWRFGYFMSELPYEVGNVQEAFNALMPEDVMLAEHSEIQWLRHGEWFFVEMGKLYSFRDKLRVLLERATKSIEEFDAVTLILINDYKMEAGAAHDMLYDYVYGTLQLSLPDAPNKQRTFSSDAFIEKMAILPAHGTQREGHHMVSKMIKTPDGERYCSGTVRHIHNEHKMMRLGTTWWRAIPNTQVTAWGASGRID